MTLMTSRLSRPEPRATKQERSPEYENPTVDTSRLVACGSGMSEGEGKGGVIKTIDSAQIIVTILSTTKF
ncbi:hypothetical protein NQ317_003470 [Molorchus minor]|uniref:Uncharacterized protein n=1 Tax=Molorchus minor TaxID=1323400 RepID=A0ABQ9K0M7_9CUCU|nr:hypothetical protein NQ317_003470 [Molorchus minor]